MHIYIQKKKKQKTNGEEVDIGDCNTEKLFFLDNLTT